MSGDINTVGDAENSSPAMHFMVRAGDVADGTIVAFTADYLAVAPHGIAHSHLDALCHLQCTIPIMYSLKQIKFVTCIKHNKCH